MKIKHKLYGAILGDLAGQPYEFPVSLGPHKNVNIHNPNSKITDDTVMTLASAAAILGAKHIEAWYRQMGIKYPDAGYGKGFKNWLFQEEGFTTNSWGNGCLMRISPFMYTEDPLPLIMESVMCSHAHEYSILAAIDLYKAYLNDYRHDIRGVEKFTKFEVRADITIKWVLNAFFNLPMPFKAVKTTQRLIKKVIEYGGDTDTNASIIGELSNFWYNDITDKDVAYVDSKLDPFLLKILKEFNKKFKD